MVPPRSGKMVASFLVVAASLLALADGRGGGGPDPTCEPIKIDMCRSLGYNMTGMPNLAMNSRQSDAAQNLETWSPLIGTRCANELQFFLCSVYTPMCVSLDGLTSSSSSDASPARLIGPCKPLCERVKSRCLPDMKKFGVSWPEVLKCSKFPERNDGENSMCMQGPGESHRPLSLPPSSLNVLQTNPFIIKKVQDIQEQLKDKEGGLELKDINRKNFNKILQLLGGQNGGAGGPANRPQEPFNKNNNRLRPFVAPAQECSHLKKANKYHYIKRLDACVPECEADISFSGDEKAFASHWIIGLSVLSLTLGIASFVTLLVDNYCSSGRMGVLANSGGGMTVAQFAFRVPPLFFTLCCCFYSLGFLISQMLQSSHFCIQDDENEEVMLGGREGHRNQPCVVVFILVYFFGNAASHWWTVATFTWCASLITSRKRLSASETVPKHSSPVRWPALSPLCHVYAWLVPAVLTLTALLTRNVESDELTSVCLPGASFSDESILYFILIPESIQLFFGCLFYVVGIVTALIYKSRLQQKTLEQQRFLNKKSSGDLGIISSLRCRMGIFGIFYILPKLCSFVTVVYEYMFRSLWLVSSQTWLPNMEIFMLRIFMFLFVGMSCLWWIWRKEVVSSWLNCCTASSCCASSSSKTSGSGPGGVPGMWSNTVKAGSTGTAPPSSTSTGGGGGGGAGVQPTLAANSANLYPDVAYHVQSQQIDSSSAPMIPNHCYRL